jgi:hypothetical protein
LFYTLECILKGVEYLSDGPFFAGRFSGAAAAWPFAARAQPTSRRVGALILGNADAQSFKADLREGLRKRGYVEGQNIQYEFRSADGNIALLSKLAAELVALKVDIIVALYTPCSLAAKQATRDIPIVTISGDPVGFGLVASLARPGGNITGISMIGAELLGKGVELLRRITELFAGPHLHQGEHQHDCCTVFAGRLCALQNLSRRQIFATTTPPAPSFFIAANAASISSGGICPSNNRRNLSWWSISRPAPDLFRRAADLAVHDFGSNLNTSTFAPQGNLPVWWLCRTPA